MRLSGQQLPPKQFKGTPHVVLQREGAARARSGLPRRALEKCAQNVPQEQIMLFGFVHFVLLELLESNRAQAVKFFNIAGQTMESFVRTLSEDNKRQDMDSDESQFVLGLAGIVTNVAALAIGREFLVSSNQVLLDTMIQLLRDMKPGCCTKLKVLMLMSLYNISINMKGVKYISENTGFFPLLWWLLNDPDPEVCFHVLRLLQSMVMEPEILTKSALEIRDSLPLPRILMLSKSRNRDLQILAQELLEDLKVLEGEMMLCLGRRFVCIFKRQKSLGLTNQTYTVLHRQFQMEVSESYLFHSLPPDACSFFQYLHFWSYL
ncbi:heat shock factor 2-binding protein isoform 3-T3 [Liasis olivaceus]